MSFIWSLYSETHCYSYRHVRQQHRPRKCHQHGEWSKHHNLATIKANGQSSSSVVISATLIKFTAQRMNTLYDINETQLSWATMRFPGVSQGWIVGPNVKLLSVCWFPCGLGVDEALSVSHVWLTETFLIFSARSKPSDINSPWGHHGGIFVIRFF